MLSADAKPVFGKADFTPAVNLLFKNRFALTLSLLFQNRLCIDPKPFFPKPALHRRLTCFSKIGFVSTQKLLFFLTGCTVTPCLLSMSLSCVDAEVTCHSQCWGLLSQHEAACLACNAMQTLFALTSFMINPVLLWLVRNSKTWHVPKRICRWSGFAV